MVFPLSQLQDAIAAVLVAGGWVRVNLEDSPEASAQAHHSFAFDLPSKGKPTAWSSSGQLSVYSWGVRFVWHLDLASDSAKATALQAATEAMAAVQFRTSWLADLETLGIEPGPVVVASGETRVLVVSYTVKAQVHETAPAF